MSAWSSMIRASQRHRHKVVGASNFAVDPSWIQGGPVGLAAMNRGSTHPTRLAQGRATPPSNTHSSSKTA